MVDADGARWQTVRSQRRADTLTQDRGRHARLRRPRDAVRFHHSQMAHLQRHRPAELHEPVLGISFLDNTACNLASLNLMKFKGEDGVFNVERFKAAARI